MHWREADLDHPPELRLRRPEHRPHSCRVYSGYDLVLRVHFDTLSLFPPILLTYVALPVFETEMMGIEGVPQPESIVTKSATDSPASSASEKVAEKVASAVSEATEAVKTVVADTDDTQEHNEL